MVDTINIPVVQYIRPNGVRALTRFQVPDPDGSVSRNIALFKKLDIEVTFEAIDATKVILCLDSVNVGDYDSRIVTYDALFIAQVTDMIMNFDQAKYDKWVQFMYEMEEVHDE